MRARARRFDVRAGGSEASSCAHGERFLLFSRMCSGDRFRLGNLDQMEYTTAPKGERNAAAHKSFPRVSDRANVMPMGDAITIAEKHAIRRAEQMPTMGARYDYDIFEDDWAMPEPPRVSSSFAGALLRAMRMMDLPITQADLALISYPLTDADVAHLLDARRLPTVDEVAVLADTLGLSFDELLECQRTVRRRRMPKGCMGEYGGANRLVQMKLMVPPEVRTALRLRKATTGKDMNDLLMEILSKALVDELVMVRGY